MKHTASMRYEPSTEARELFLCADNYSVIYPRIKAVVNSLHKHYIKGNFDKIKAVDAFFPVLTIASDIYNKEFGYRFSVTERYTASVDMVEHYMDSIISNDINE